MSRKPLVFSYSFKLCFRKIMVNLRWLKNLNSLYFSRKGLSFHRKLIVDLVKFAFLKDIFIKISQRLCPGFS